ncbi:protein NRT1/ PTR FAMILY 6.3-like [Canna indica]|uniref:Protein NRT1/ PTR FAMILY 6.3-like n=1 Tax=Canna indica TaxID=4628 RepID=A0AAQ3QCJ6_9LILI|nr:protein NRT1/ PTR FAMILY 6.3-like [Canna indica]
MLPHSISLFYFPSLSMRWAACVRHLVTYLTGTMHIGNAEGANVVTNFMGSSFMLYLLGGFVVDTFLGRYLTIAIFASVQDSISRCRAGVMPIDVRERRLREGFQAIAGGALLGTLPDGTWHRRVQVERVRDNLGRWWGYGLCVASISVGLVVFVLGTRRYMFKKLVGSVEEEAARAAVRSCTTAQYG